MPTALVLIALATVSLANMAFLCNIMLHIK